MVLLRRRAGTAIKRQKIYPSYTGLTQSGMSILQTQSQDNLKTKTIPPPVAPAFTTNSDFYQLNSSSGNLLKTDFGMSKRSMEERTDMKMKLPHQIDDDSDSFGFIEV